MTTNMVQREITVWHLRQLFNGNFDKREGTLAFLHKMPHTTVRVTRTREGNKEIDYVRGGVAVGYHGIVMVGKPSLQMLYNNKLSDHGRSPPFEQVSFAVCYMFLLMQV